MESCEQSLRSAAAEPGAEALSRATVDEACARWGAEVVLGTLKRLNDPEFSFLSYVGAVPYPSALIPPDTRSAVEGGVRDAAHACGVSPPALRYFRSLKGAGPERGWFDERLPGIVWIRADLAPDAGRRVAIHETSHYADHRAGREISEPAAEALVKQLTAPPSRGIVINRPAPHRGVAPAYC